MDNAFSLLDKSILVTGASSGIGRATSIILSKMGARVILSSRRPEELKETLNMMENREAHIIEPFDLSNLAEIPEWVRKVATRDGRQLNGLVHSAGISKMIPINAFSPTNIENIILLNIKTSLLLLKGLSAKNVSAEGSSLVFISSSVAISGSPGFVEYAVTKGGIVSMVKSAARELAKRRIRVNCVVPGIVETPMIRNQAALNSGDYMESIKRHPLGLGKPEDVGNAIAFLLTPAAQWITGTAMVVDGGYLS